MQTVAVAIREDLSKVKDVLDIFVRRGAGQPQELASQVEMLRKIGDTLGVLGLGELRGSVQAETDRLGEDRRRNTSRRRSHPRRNRSDPDRCRGSSRRPVRRPDPSEAARPTPKSEDHEFQQVQARGAARMYPEPRADQGSDLPERRWHARCGRPRWLAGLDAGLEAGLLMLGKARAVEVIEGITSAA